MDLNDTRWGQAHRWLAPSVICIVLVGCTSGPLGNQARIADMPLAASHADLVFSLTTGPRLDTDCRDDRKCVVTPTRSKESRFLHQVRRVARTLQRGVQATYPDLRDRAPDLADGRFDVFVVEGDEPDTDCSADGRIAVNAEFARWPLNDGLLAFIIAREMGHVIARHPEENSVACMATSVLMNVIIPGGMLLKTAVSTGGSGVAFFSQRDQQAAEADQIALNLLKASGYGLRKVAYTLRSKRLPYDDGRWSKDFKRSAATLIAEAKGGKTASVTIAGGL